MSEIRIEPHAHPHPWAGHEWAWRCYYVNGVKWEQALIARRVTS